MSALLNLIPRSIQVPYGIDTRFDRDTLPKERNRPVEDWTKDEAGRLVVIAERTNELVHGSDDHDDVEVADEVLDYEYYCWIQGAVY